MKFSICIPNYNYARYIDQTIASVLNQGVDVEIIVSDNASTDASVAVIEGFDDPRIRVHRNAWNVGFAPNLDRACQGATGDRQILLSSDDIIEADGLSAYARLAEALGDAANRAVFASSVNVIDGDGVRTGSSGMDWKQWRGAQKDMALSDAVGAEVWRIDAATLLRQSLLMMRVPFAFAATCYPRSMYDAVEGYSAPRHYSPDKAFAWKLLSVADEAFHVERPLFGYRVHNANQEALQIRQRALKHLIDEYSASFDTPSSVLERAGVRSDEIEAAFVEHDIGLRGLKLLATGRRDEAARGVRFARAAYPARTSRNRTVLALRTLLALGPVGALLAKRLYERTLRAWNREQR